MMIQLQSLRSTRRSRRHNREEHSATIKARFPLSSPIADENSVPQPKQSDGCINSSTRYCGGSGKENGNHGLTNRAQKAASAKAPVDDGDKQIAPKDAANETLRQTQGCEVDEQESFSRQDSLAQLSSPGVSSNLRTGVNFHPTSPDQSVSSVSSLQRVSSTELAKMESSTLSRDDNERKAEPEPKGTPRPPQLEALCVFHQQQQ